MTHLRGLVCAGWIIVAALAARGHAYVYYAYEQVTGPVGPSLSWPGEDFESYSDGQVIESSSDMMQVSHFDVTWGTLKSKYAGSWRRGWTGDTGFRAVALGYDVSGRRIRWTDQVIRYSAYIDSWHADVEDWSGVHVFARYRSSIDLYVASLRYDGTVTIKRKWDDDGDGVGDYTLLASGNLANTFPNYLDASGHLKTDIWYDLEFSAVGPLLTFSVDGEQLLSVNDWKFQWGTGGIRIDHSNTYIDDWTISAPNPEPATLLLSVALAGPVVLWRPVRRGALPDVL